jgi:hypothetical protein
MDVLIFSKLKKSKPEGLVFSREISFLSLSNSSSMLEILLMISFCFCLLFLRSPRVDDSKYPLIITELTLIHQNLLEEEVLNVLELILQILEFLVVVLLDGRHLVPDGGQLTDLIFDLVLELCHLVLQVVYTQLIQHHDIMVSVFTKETLEADAAEVVLAECLDFFSRMDFAFALVNLAYLVTLHLFLYLFF